MSRRPGYSIVKDQRLSLLTCIKPHPLSCFLVSHLLQSVPYFLQGFTENQMVVGTRTTGGMFLMFCRILPASNVGPRTADSVACPSLSEEHRLIFVRSKYGGTHLLLPYVYRPVSKTVLWSVHLGYPSTSSMIRFSM